MMTNVERCFGTLPSGRCARRAAHHGHCATGGSYAQALDERDDAREQLRWAVEACNAGVDLLDELTVYWEVGDLPPEVQDTFDAVRRRLTEAGGR